MAKQLQQILAPREHNQTKRLSCSAVCIQSPKPLCTSVGPQSTNLTHILLSSAAPRTLEVNRNVKLGVANTCCRAVHIRILYNLQHTCISQADGEQISQLQRVILCCRRRRSCWSVDCSTASAAHCSLCQRGHCSMQGAFHGAKLRVH